ncbi:hypothetical protein [Streptomyces sp. NPDC058254]|uniref:hypothetical protein n=1 Tax=Streptomyces sp. NPDC058254 TaxID=3346406 RepID=UPI0036F10206
MSASVRDNDAYRLAALRLAVLDLGGEWTTRRVQRVYVEAFGPGPWRRTARRDLAALNREGLLTLNDKPDRRHYTTTRTEERS